MVSEDFQKYLESTKEIGEIVHVAEPIVYLSGLPFAKPWEEIVSEDGERGMVFGLDRRKIEVLMFEMEKVEAGKKVVRTGEPFKIGISEKILGRIVNPLCKPLDGLGPILGEKEYLTVQRPAPGITQRVKVNRQLETGVTAVDLLVTLGYGQRETIIGDAQTSKENFILQTMAYQAKKGVICIYVGIGKKASFLKLIEAYLKDMKIFNNVALVVTTANQPATLHYFAPFAGMTIAEYFRDKGNDVIIAFDDFSTHAKAYREISLLTKRAPGREAYPGDIFHIHAMLMERAGNIRLENGKEVSITAFPLVETLENDISGFIQTNVLAMTDGHIFFDIEELKRGRIPPINTFLSVSRVGNQTKKDLDKELAGIIKQKLIDYRNALEVAQFGAELSKETQKILDLGRRIEILLNQDQKTLIPRAVQVLIFGLLLSGLWKDIPLNRMEKEIAKIYEIFQGENLKILEEELDKMKTVDQLKDFCEDFIPDLEKLI